MAKSDYQPGVFISYARSDARKVNSILKGLAARGVITKEDSVFKEEDLPAKHAELRKQVQHLIRSSSKFIVVWGKNSAQSQWVNYELGLADAFVKQVIVVIDGADQLPLPIKLKDVQIVNISAEE